MSAVLNAGECHADRAALAAILEGLGRHEEAEQLYKRALRVFRKTYGPEHYDIAIALNNLGAVYQARGEMVSAHWHYQRALAMKERLLGPEHVDVAITLNNLAGLSKTRGDWKAALRYYQRALAILVAALPPRHPKVVRCCANYRKLREQLAHKAEQSESVVS